MCTTRSPRAAEPRCPRLADSDTGEHSSVRYVGAAWCRHLYTRTHTLHRPTVFVLQARKLFDYCKVKVKVGLDDTSRDQTILTANLRLSTNRMNHTCPWLPSRSWSSFIDPGKMKGWVGLGTTTPQRCTDTLNSLLRTATWRISRLLVVQTVTLHWASARKHLA